MIALPRADMEHCIKIGTFGLRRKLSIQKVKKGDQIACYVTGEMKIVAVGEAISDYYLDDSNVFLKNDAIVDRFNFKVEKLKQEISFTAYLDQWSWITNLAHWAVYFRVGIVQMKQRDWDMISKVITESGITNNTNTLK